MNIEQFSNIDLENDLLGIILNDKKILDDLIDIDENVFYNTANKKLFLTIKCLWRNSKEVTVANIYALLKTKINEVGGISRITDLQTEYVTSAGYKDIAKALNDYKIRRDIRDIQTDIEKMLSKEEENQLILNKINNSIEKINNTDKEDDGEIEESIEKLLCDVEERSKNNGKIRGISTGLNGFDRKINGLNKQEYMIIAARPGQGKTTLVNNIAINAMKKNHKIAIFNLEMSKEQIFEKILSNVAMVQNDKIKLGSLEDNEWERLARAQGLLIKNKNNLKVFDSILSIDKIIAAAKKLKKRNTLDILIVDYLQLIECDSKKNNREQEVSSISRRLKLLSKELDINVIVLAQLSRAPEQRADHRPILSDLRESGSIEQDADIVTFVYRDEYYNKETEERRIMEIIIGKNRNGSTGTEKVAWIPEYQKVTDLELA